MGQAVTSPHPGCFCSWIALSSPAPQGTLRATHSCTRMAHASFPSPALARATLLGPHSCWITAGDTPHEPWWTALPPLEDLPQEKHVINSNLFLFLCFKHINYQVELRKSTCLARCPQPGMRAVNFSLGSWNPSSLPALCPSERPGGDDRSPPGFSPRGPACPRGSSLPGRRARGV